MIGWEDRTLNPTSSLTIYLSTIHP